MADDYNDNYEDGAIVRRGADGYTRKKVNWLVEEMETVKTNVSAFSVALFGHPQDRSDAGIVGNVSDTRQKLDELSNKIDKIVWGLFGLLATGITAVIVAILNHP